MLGDTKDNEVLQISIVKILILWLIMICAKYEHYNDSAAPHGVNAHLAVTVYIEQKMKLLIYFDYSATCPVDPRVAENMVYV